MIRRPNAPYFKLDIAGRLVINAYRVADRRRPGVDPLVQRVDERGRFDTTQGVFVRVGRMGIMAALHGNGPAYRKSGAR